ncbi:MAG: hypothetical protein JSS91_01875 [Bacteroidetes bacterium]|nr:hypothetical protein [Bacteroidota bacterium]
MKNIVKYLPLLIPVFILVIIISLVYYLSYKITGGEFIYSLDDAYIHLAYAKNIYLHNVWGITQNGFTSTSSSPIWTMAIAGIFFLTDVNVFIPFIFNVIISVILLIVIFRIFREEKLPDVYTSLVLIFIIIFTPLSIHIYSGMEHLLHCVLVLMFVHAASGEFAGSDRSFTLITPSKIKLTVLSFFLMTVRYESIFLIYIAVVLFLMKREIKFVLSMIIAGFLGSSVYGTISVLKGRAFFPDSVMLKNNFFMSFQNLFGDDPFGKFLIFMDMNKKFIVLFVISITLLIIIIRLKKDFRNYISTALIILLSTAVLQKIFVASTFFRYDSYLLIAFICFDAIAVNYIFKRDPKVYRIIASPGKSSAAVLFLFIVFSYFGYKQFYIDKTVTAVKNIYEQQYQMAGFIKEYYTGSSVALNDIGAVNFYADINCIDLIGLGTPEIADARINGTFDKIFLEEICRKNNVRIAVIYDEWFDRKNVIPDNWRAAGKWKIRDNYICGSDEVTFYAVGSDAFPDLINDLRNYSFSIPDDVIQSGDYKK